MPTPYPETPGAVVLDAERAVDLARDLCAFVDASPMPYQAVAEGVRRLTAAGYTELREDDVWEVAPGARHYVVRGGSTLLAFVVGGEAPEESGVAGFGAHVDSPNLRVKPHPDEERLGYRRLAVDTYGGLIIATWLDRELGVAGRVFVREPGVAAATPRLVTIRRPVARLPNLAIHLNREANEKAPITERQVQLPPLTGMASTPGGLCAVLAAELGVAEDTIVDWDLGLFDVQPSALCGFADEMIAAPRLDNLAMSHAGLTALLATGGTESAATRLIALYDHEECGSQSVQGAQGTLLLDVIRRLAEGHPGRRTSGHETTARTLARSLVISADMAHAMHPSWPECYEPAHHPMLNRGPAIKRNVNQSYATDGETAARFAGYCRDAGFEPQHYVQRTGMRCGSTIGAITAARAGLQVVDVGNPMLAMHSARETGGTFDVDLMIQALLRHFG